MTAQARWRTILQNVHLRSDDLTAEELSRSCGLPPGDIQEMLVGDSTPTRANLARLVFAVTDKPGEREKILSAFGAETGPAVPFLDSRTDMQRLADAISDLAEAITEFAHQVKAAKPTQSDHH